MKLHEIDNLKEKYSFVNPEITDQILAQQELLKKRKEMTYLIPLILDELKKIQSEALNQPYGFTGVNLTLSNDDTSFILGGTFIEYLIEILKELGLEITEAGYTYHSEADEATIKIQWIATKSIIDTNELEKNWYQAEIDITKWIKPS